jgi:drug/metabolite transporter (DMT)-like permease
LNKITKQGGIAPANALMLFACALIWGTAFVAQSVGNNYMGPITFQASRSVLAIVVLLPLVLVRSRARTKRIKANDRNVQTYSFRTTVKGGLLCGLMLCSASILQQIGITGTDVGKSGFITAMYIVLVPVLSFFISRKASIRVWISVAIAVTGLYFLCVSGGSLAGITKYDLMLVACAFLFSLQIILIDYFAKNVDGVELSLGQFITTTVISVILMFVFERPQISDIISGAFPVIYAGIMSSGVAYTLQIVGQKGQDPTISSLIMSLESVISVLAGWVILGQKLTAREGVGCILMFLAIILAQLPDKKRCKEV